MYYQIVPSLTGWLPGNPDDGTAYHRSLLGRFLRCTTIRENTIQGRYISPYFNRGIINTHDIAQVFDNVIAEM